MFNLFEEVYGVDVAALFFPGDWEQEKLPLDMDNYGHILMVMMHSLETLTPGDSLPILEAFEKEYGKKIPDPHPDRVQMEAFGSNVRELMEGIMPPGSTLDPPARPPEPKFDVAKHGRPIAYALLQLAKFGDCANRIKRETGEDVFVNISF